MPSQTQIGLVHYSPPRAVKVREPEDLENVHSAIHGEVNIYVDTQTEAAAVLAAWPVIMQHLADKTNQIVSAVKEVATT